MALSVLFLKQTARLTPLSSSQQLLFNSPVVPFNEKTFFKRLMERRLNSTV
jgi:hypothetical protein